MRTRWRKVTWSIIGLCLFIANFGLEVCHGEQGLRGEFYKDVRDDYGAWGSDDSYPQPYWIGISSNIDFVFNDEVDQYFSARWQGYLYVPQEKAGSIVFKTVTDDGAKLYLDGELVIDFWRLQAHQTIGTENDECTHETEAELDEGYHSIKFEYFEWDGGEDDPDPCKLYWDGAIVPNSNLFTEIPPSSELAITDVSASASPFNPSNSETSTISYTVSLAADVTVKLYDTEDQLVRTLVDSESQTAGDHEEEWNGKDDEGTIVDDGPYRYVITAVKDGDTVVYDPGCPATPEINDLDVPDPIPQGATTPVRYTLPCDCLVRIRIGYAYEEVLVRTLVDWEYRPSGFNESEEWDSRDEGGNLVPPADYLAAIWALAIPENAIVVEGGS